MKLNSLFIALIGLTVLCSWHAFKKLQIEKANWLIGTWENKTKRGSIYETWTKASDVQFTGKSYALKNNDTTVFETFELVQKQNSLFYIPTVKNQNNNLPVSFSLQSISDDKLVFENPEHDFPQIISYTRVTPDSLVAEISGKNNGQERKQTFPMKKIR